MESTRLRGSEKLMAAWKTRALTEESIGEIGKALDDSPANLEEAAVSGGSDASGVRLALSYQGDDVAWCGNDIIFWLKWHLKFGGTVKPPIIIINGTPYPDYVRMQLDFGHVAGPGGPRG